MVVKGIERLWCIVTLILVCPTRSTCRSVSGGMNLQQQQSTVGNAVKNSSLPRMSNSDPRGGGVIGSSGKQGSSFGRGTFHKATTTTTAVAPIPSPSAPFPSKQKKGSFGGQGTRSQKPLLQGGIDHNPSLRIQFGSQPVHGGRTPSEVNGESHAGIQEPAGDSDFPPTSAISAEVPLPPETPVAKDASPVAQAAQPASMPQKRPSGRTWEGAERSDVASQPWTMHDEDFPELGAKPIIRGKEKGNAQSSRTGSKGEGKWANISAQHADIDLSKPQEGRPEDSTQSADSQERKEVESSTSKQESREQEVKASKQMPTEGFKNFGRARAVEDAGGEQKAIDDLGRTLTKILRHEAVDLKLPISNDGYVDTEDLLKLSTRTRSNRPLSSHSVEDVLQAVEQDGKKRFALKEDNGRLFIRASQGHSIKSVETEHLLKPILSADEVPVCVHGTYLKNLALIQKDGLKRMSRNHVHFATGNYGEQDVISGMRSSSEVLIFLDVKMALEDGMKLYMSENRVILTEGFDGVVPPKYFAEVRKLSQKRSSRP